MRSAPLIRYPIEYWSAVLVLCLAGLVWIYFKKKKTNQDYLLIPTLLIIIAVAVSIIFYFWK